MTPEEKYKERLNWFYDKIGKTIWRTITTCNCSSCKEIYDNGLEVVDEGHAMYLRDVEAEYSIDALKRGGTPVVYFTTKEERDEFEKAMV